MKNEAKNMASNVHAIKDHINFEPDKKKGFFVRLALALGLMHNPNEPKYSGATIFLAIVAIGLIVYLIVDAAILKLDEKDVQRGQGAYMYDTAKRASTRADREQEKRARLLQFIKEKKLYNEVPEDLKVFESEDLEKNNLENNKDLEKK